MHTSQLSKLLGLAGAVCWAVGSILIKRLRQQTQDRPDLADGLAIADRCSAIAPAGGSLCPIAQRTGPAAYIGILSFISIASTALCWWLWTYILDRVPAWEASLSVLGAPVVALLSSRWLLGEAFDVTEVFGMLLIGLGLTMLTSDWLDGAPAPAFGRKLAPPATPPPCSSLRPGLRWRFPRCPSAGSLRPRSPGCVARGGVRGGDWASRAGGGRRGGSASRGSSTSSDCKHSAAFTTGATCRYCSRGRASGSRPGFLVLARFRGALCGLRSAPSGARSGLTTSFGWGAIGPRARPWGGGGLFWAASPG